MGPLASPQSTPASQLRPLTAPAGLVMPVSGDLMAGRRLRCATWPGDVVALLPLVVTHQTDTEQRVIEMPMLHDHAQPDRLVLTAPHGGHPHSLAPQGYYMLFILDNAGVPSVASWIYLH
jgi:hypothetical protein